MRWLSRILFIACFLRVSRGKESEEHAPHGGVRTEHYSPEGAHNADFDHEAVLGTKKKDFSAMSPEEAVKELNELVSRMDADYDGFVTRDELVNWVSKSFIALDAEEAQDKLYELDENMDDAVTWEEHLKHTYDYLPEEIEDFDKDENPEVRGMYEMISLDREKFVRADKNGDFQLSLDEYSVFLHPFNHAGMRDLELKEILLDYDKDKDGSISFEEFMGEEVPFDKEHRLSEEENFRHFDSNKDRILDEAEIEAWAMPSHTEAAEEEADHLIEDSDDNKDGRLTREEILVHQDLWVGSPATEYTKHDPAEL